MKKVSYWETLIGTISGFIIGFLAEPVKIFFNNRNEKNNLRSALYREMICNYNGLKNLLYMIKEKKVSEDAFLPNYQNCIKFDLYNYARSEKKIMSFYQLPEANEIDIINRNFALPSVEVMSPQIRIEFAKTAIIVFEKKVSKSQLDKSLLEKSGLESRLAQNP